MRDRHEDPGRRGPSDDVRSLDLAFVVDDADAPTAVTAYPERGLDERTAWITMDVAHVVDLVEHA